MHDRTALSYWFPKLLAAGLPVPRTTIIQMPSDAQEDIWAAFDGEDGTGATKPFFDALAASAAEIGFPCFLRTDHTSGKHDWERTCFVQSAADILQHVYNIAEFSECISVPWDVWVVRELLPTIPLGVCLGYGNMPICREFRFFVDDGVVRCWHPYWPLHALEIGCAPDDLDCEALCRMDDEPALRALASAAGAAVGGSWSVDLLETRRGWFITDLAEAHKSFHWDGCDKAKAERVP